MRTAFRISRLLIGIVSAAAFCVVLSYTVLAETPFGAAVQALTGHAPAAEATNAALDAAGIKSSVDEYLRNNEAAIAEATGLSELQVRAVINGLNIPSWTVVDLPSGTKATHTADVTYEGLSADVTIYDDPSYVTVSTAGQKLTLKVPESAQDYVSYLSLL